MCTAADTADRNPPRMPNAMLTVITGQSNDDIPPAHLASIISGSIGSKIIAAQVTIIATTKNAPNSLLGVVGSKPLPNSLTDW